MSPVRLRSREASDEQFLFDLYSAHRAQDFAPLPLPQPQKEQLIRTQYQAQRGAYAAQYPDSDYQIVLRDDCPIGKIWIARMESEFHLVDILLAPEARNSGIGNSLIRGLQKEAEAVGLPVRSSVFRFNPGSLRFHLRLGFQIVAEDEVEFRMEWLPDPLSFRQ